MVREERGTSIRGLACDLCNSVGVITAAEARAYRIATSSAVRRT